MLNKFKEILLIWVSAAVTVGPVSYLALYYLNENSYSIALSRAMIITVSMAFISTWLRYPPRKG
jgi:hypothetical protein